jgi:hypothetical protein
MQALEGLKKGTQYDTTNQKVKQEKIQKDYEDGRIGVLEYTDKMNKEQKKESQKLSKQFNEALNASADKSFYKYNKDTGEFLLDEKKFKKLSKERQEEIKKEYEYLKGIND